MPSSERISAVCSPISGGGPTLGGSPAPADVEMRTGVAGTVTSALTSIIGASPYHRAHWRVRPHPIDSPSLRDAFVAGGGEAVP